MDLKNAAEFDRVVTCVLTALAESFPRLMDLNFHALGLADGPGSNLVNGRYLDTESTPQHQFASHCVRFLLAEEYISGTVHPVWAAGVLLTAKGLELINAIPDSLLRGTHS